MGTQNLPLEPSGSTGLHRRDDSAKTRFWLDGWLVEPAAHRISWHSRSAVTGAGGSTGGKSVATSIVTLGTEPRLMKLLCALAAEAGEVVEREELINRLWPRVVVTENSLTRAVSELRRLLAQAPENTVRIQTIPKRGYCLHAAVTPAGAPLNGPAAPAVADATGQWSSKVRVWQYWPVASAAAVVLLISTALLISSLSAPSFTAGTNVSAPDQPLHDRVLHSQALLNSPVNTLYDAQNQADTRLFWLIDDAQETIIPAHQTAIPKAIVAPEHNLVAFVEQLSGISSLKLRPFAGDAAPWVAFTTSESIGHLQWSPLGDGVLFTVTAPVRETDGRSYQRLMLLDIETLALHELYRRAVTDQQEHTQAASGKLT